MSDHDWRTARTLRPDDSISIVSIPSSDSENSDSRHHRHRGPRRTGVTEVSGLYRRDNERSRGHRDRGQSRQGVSDQYGTNGYLSESRYRRQERDMAALILTRDAINSNNRNVRNAGLQLLNEIGSRVGIPPVNESSTGYNMYPATVGGNGEPYPLRETFGDTGRSSGFGLDDFDRPQRPPFSRGWERNTYMYSYGHSRRGSDGDDESFSERIPRNDNTRREFVPYSSVQPPQGIAWTVDSDGMSEPEGAYSEVDEPPDYNPPSGQTAGTFNPRPGNSFFSGRRHRGDQGGHYPPSDPRGGQSQFPGSDPYGGGYTGCPVPRNSGYPPASQRNVFDDNYPRYS